MTSVMWYEKQNKQPDVVVSSRIRLARNCTELPFPCRMSAEDRRKLSDRVEGLDRGADYYLTTPFEPRELMACVRALTRRQPELRNTDILSCGDLSLDKSSFTLSCGDRNVRLSRKEFDMMELFMLNQKQVITKENLLVKIWGYESDAEDNNVEVYVSFLRRKLEHLRSQVKIRTIRMVGYCLEYPAS